MGCFTKLGLFVLNFAIFAAGVAVVALASIIINKDNNYGNRLISDGIFTLPIIILIAGLIIVIIGFLGCCGAMKESSCMLKLYAAIVTLMLIGEIILGILLLVYPNKAEDHIIEGMTSVFNGYGSPDDKALTDSIDNIQHDLHCCGVKNYTDWQDIPWANKVNVSDDCCREIVPGCGKDVAQLSEEEASKVIYTQGCYYALKEDLMTETVALGVILFIMAIVQVMAVSCACGLAKKSNQYA